MQRLRTANETLRLEIIQLKELLVAEREKTLAERQKTLDEKEQRLNERQTAEEHRVLLQQHNLRLQSELNDALRERESNKRQRSDTHAMREPRLSPGYTRHYTESGLPADAQMGPAFVDIRSDGRV